MSPDQDRDRDEKPAEKVTGANEVGEAVEEAIDEGPSREHAEKKPPESHPGKGDSGDEEDDD